MLLHATPSSVCVCGACGSSSEMENLQPPGGKAGFVGREQWLQSIQQGSWAASMLRPLSEGIPWCVQHPALGTVGFQEAGSLSGGYGDYKLHRNSIWDPCTNCMTQDKSIYHLASITSSVKGEQSKSGHHHSMSLRALKLYGQVLSPTS